MPNNIHGVHLAKANFYLFGGCEEVVGAAVAIVAIVVAIHCLYASV
jgi:hypothetical protein